jgi:hypothetical protein
MLEEHFGKTVIISLLLGLFLGWLVSPSPPLDNNKVTYHEVTP